MDNEQYKHQNEAGHDPHCLVNRGSREKKSLWDILKERTECIKDADTGTQCNKSWLSTALQLLQKNNIKPQRFSSLVSTALKHGRGKGRNLMIIGEKNCGKSFMLMPLLRIYDCFTCPSGLAFNFVGAHD